MFVQVHCVPSKADILGAALKSIKGDTFIYLRVVMLRKKRLFEVLNTSERYEFPGEVSVVRLGPLTI